MRRLKKYFLLFCLAMLVSIIPFLILGETFEEQITQWFKSDWTSSQRFWLIVALLAADILIPIPSSAVSTYGGAILGFVPATIASWLGMTLGSLSGFLLARLAGPKIVARLTKRDDLSSLEKLNERYSLWTIVITRPLPILAEATILLIGSLKLPWSKLLLPLLISNLIIAICYSAIGAWSIEYDVTLYVIIASIILPLLLTTLVRWRLRKAFAKS